MERSVSFGERKRERSLRGRLKYRRWIYSILYIYLYQLAVEARSQLTIIEFMEPPGLWLNTVYQSSSLTNDKYLNDERTKSLKTTRISDHLTTEHDQKINLSELCPLLCQDAFKVGQDLSGLTLRSCPVGLRLQLGRGLGGADS
jgi:hypothetical protein